MEVRDAVEADATAMARLADAPTEVMRGVVHDRTVRVIETPEDTAESSPSVEDTAEGSPSADPETGATKNSQGYADDPDSSRVAGFVSFDARSDTVYVTQLAGNSLAVCSRLLEEPQRFASGEGMAVEIVVEEAQDHARDAAHQKGFEPVGPGPRFDGESTTRFRLSNG